MNNRISVLICSSATIAAAMTSNALSQSDEVVPNEYTGIADFDSWTEYELAGFLSYVYVSPLMDFFSERADGMIRSSSDEGQRSSSTLILPTDCTLTNIGIAPNQTFYVNQTSYLPSLSTCTNPVVRPDHGHLYVNSWLDMTGGPVEISYDALRYSDSEEGAIFAVQFLDPLSNNIFHIAPWGNLEPDGDKGYGQVGSVTNPGGAVGWYEGAVFYVWYSNAPYADEFTNWLDDNGVPERFRIEYDQPLGWMLGRVTVPFGELDQTRELCRTFCAKAMIKAPKGSDFIYRDPSLGYPDNPLSTGDVVDCTDLLNDLNDGKDLTAITYLDRAAKCLGYQQPPEYRIQFPENLVTDLYQDAMELIGVSADIGGPSNASLTDAQIAEVVRGFRKALEQFCSGDSPSSSNETWTVPLKATGNYEQKYYYRAFVAQQGFGAEVSTYEYYPTAENDENKDPLMSYKMTERDGVQELVPQEYLLVMDKERLDAACAMWSLTMYYEGPTAADGPDGESSEITAAILCCSQNNSCENLSTGCISDIGTKHTNWAGGQGPISYLGKYFVVMSPEPPDESLKGKVNWLPTPNTNLPSTNGGCASDQQASGDVEFNVTLRVYNAKISNSGTTPSLQNGWPLPCIRRWDSSLGLESAGCTPETIGCTGDLNDDGRVDQFDLVMLLGDWGCLGSCVGDLDGNGEVGPTDLSLMIGVWGTCEGE
ncbi:MAG: DUF1254 domain-containing protein [Planctomycetota bacterium]|nr:DUF1254 domain-containing protein [Planctomycetota bacterium]